MVAGVLFAVKLKEGRIQLMLLGSAELGINERDQLEVLDDEDM